MTNSGEYKINNGFQVVVPFPNRIFQTIRQEGEGRMATVAMEIPLTDNVFDLSNTTLEGVLFDYESTTMAPGGIYGDPNKLEMRSVLEISQVERSKSPFGYYDILRLSTVANFLKQQGVDCEIEQMGVHGSISIPSTIDNTDIAMSIDFGYISKDAELEVQKLALKAAKGRIKKPIPVALHDVVRGMAATVSPTFLQKNAQKVLKRGNERIEIFLIDDLNLHHGEVSLGDETFFTQCLLFYAGGYEKVIKALYRERGMELPHTQIVLDAAQMRGN